MPSKGQLLGLISAAVLGGVALLMSSPARRAKLPWVGDRAQAVLTSAPCTQLPSLSDAELIALLDRESMDPCGHLEALSREHPAVLTWLSDNALSEVVGPESLQLRGARVLMRDEPSQYRPRVAEELQRGRLGPGSRQALTQTMFLELEGAIPPDPTGLHAALAFAQGNPQAAGELAAALERELRWPTLVPENDPLNGLPELLVAGALDGLGLTPAEITEARTRLQDGRPVQELDTPALLALQDHDSDCSSPVPACMAMLMAMLEPELAPAPLPPLPGVHEGDLPLFHALAESVAQAPDPAGRLLGLVAHPGHSYGPLAHGAGQRGDPAVALRYGGGPPAATALAAHTIGQLAGVPVEVTRSSSGAWTLSAGGRTANIGDCGPGALAGAPQSVLAEDEILLWAGWEEVAGLAQAGAVGAAMERSRDLAPLPESLALRADLLACQGIRASAQPLPGHAAAWASGCGHPELADRLAQEAGAPLEELLKQRAKQDSDADAPLQCGPSLQAAPPLFQADGGIP